MGVMGASQGPQQRVATATISQSPLITVPGVARSEDEHMSSPIVAACTSSAVAIPVTTTAPAISSQDMVPDCGKSNGLPNVPLASELGSVCLPLCELDLDE